MVIGLFGITLAAVTIVTSVQIGRMIRRRLAPLHAGLMRMAEGDLEHRITSDGSDEFSELAQSINAMTGQLQGSTRELGLEISRRLVLVAQQENEARFRAWFDLPLIGIGITSPEKGWIDANDHLCTLLGYSREELLRFDWAELTHPDDLAADTTQFEQVLRGEREGYLLEKRFLRKDGGTLPSELAVRCIRKADGTVDYFVALIQDISERKQAELALLESEQRFRSLFNNAEVAMFRSRLDGSATLDCNDKFLELIGQTREEVIDRPSMALWEDPQARAEVIRGLEAEGRVTDLEFGLVRPDGEVRHCLCSMKLFRGDGVIEGSILDISIRKHAQEEKEKLQA